MAAPEAAPSHSAPSPSSVASAPSEAAAPSNEVVLAQAIQLSPDATACSPQPPLSEPSSVTLASPNQASLQQQLYGSAGRSEQEGQDLYRLKIVGIPAGYSEEQLRSLFQLCGSVAESRIVHDKQSGRPVGYGYVSFFTKEAADLAISTFDDQLQLQGAATYLSVYYAKKQHDTVNDKESCPARNAKLYFCGTPAGLRRDSILALFSAFGRVRHLQVYTDSYGVLSSGTVTMYSTDEAIAAMDSLDGKVLQPGTAPLKVTWAQLSTLPRRNPAGGGPPPPMPRGFTVSYACIPTSATPAEVAATFERFGIVLQVVPFAHRREGPANSRGCGLVVMDSERAAMTAVEALSGVFSWPGAERPLLVQPFYGAERMNPNQSLPGLRDIGLGGGGPGGGPQGGQYSRGSSGGGGMRGAPTNHHSAASAGRWGMSGRVYQNQKQHWPGNNNGQMGQRSSPSAGGSMGLMDVAEAPPPPGCGPDAFKLVLTNLPGSYTQSDIFSLLQPYGSVVSVTHTPPGDGGGEGAVVVWYQTGAQADAALAALSNTVLMAAEGTRQLQLKAFKGPPGRLPGGSPMQGQHQQYQQHRSAGGMWHSPGATHGFVSMQQAQGLAAYQQQQMPGMMQGGGFVGAGQQQQQVLLQPQGLLGGDGGMGEVWMTGGGVSAAPPGLTGMGNQLAGVAAATAAMSTAPNSYSMQQLLYMLPQQQQQPQMGGGMPSPGVGAFQGGNMMLPNGTVSLSSNSNLDPALQSMSMGVGDPSLGLGPSVSAAASLLAPAGTGYSGWLG